MSKDTPENYDAGHDQADHDQDQNGTVRSTKSIKAGLLRRAFDGKSRYTPTEIIARILEAGHRSKTLSEEHRDALNDIDKGQPRSVLMLNTIARHEGHAQRFTDNSTQQSKKTFVMPESLTLQ